ncbi:unnamed protein product [Gongylonema pulchrum]|uniref:MH2 domain-containing protein n=1 Tax=Gongylonema pulchrum TaxID=637853 RepID=A0A183EHC5_9BILA|nr:unnamed protein product [Gongylonema pulchrum]
MSTLRLDALAAPAQSSSQPVTVNPTPANVISPQIRQTQPLPVQPPLPIEQNSYCDITPPSALSMLPSGAARDAQGDPCPWLNQNYNLDVIRLPSTPMSDHWCSISYYELDTQIGEAFRVRKDQTEVSGFFFFSGKYAFCRSCLFVFFLRNY